ncbi:MAG: urease accessory protein UreE [Rickettsiales bacterium]|jgi:urease accessory protein|nr:urease accessory protein UreE [Rickettsiales bacterium]|tara:strand:- start:1343 stop:1801 length:459 start_codon:yes stop_codon:yes gene_type:complete
MIKGNKIILRKLSKGLASSDSVTLNYDNRYRRRIAMKTDGGKDFLLDLAKTTELRSGDLIELEDGRFIEVKAASEKLMKATSDEPLLILKAAWHIGNRHLSCEIQMDNLILRFDHVILQMLENLGLTLEVINQPFNPEGGAYGDTRTTGHQH